MSEREERMRAGRQRRSDPSVAIEQYRHRRSIGTKRPGDARSLVEADRRSEVQAAVSFDASVGYHDQSRSVGRLVGFPRPQLRQHSLAEAAMLIPEQEQRRAATQVGERDSASGERRQRKIGSGLTKSYGRRAGPNLKISPGMSRYGAYRPNARR